MTQHVCSKCGSAYSVSRNMASNKLPFFFNFFEGPFRKFERLESVVCPNCGWEEKDENTRFLGLKKPKWVAVGLLLFLLVIAVLEVVITY